MSNGVYQLGEARINISDTQRVLLEHFYDFPEVGTRVAMVEILRALSGCVNTVVTTDILFVTYKQLDKAVECMTRVIPSKTYHEMLEVSLELKLLHKEMDMRGIAALDLSINPELLCQEVVDQY